MGELNPSTLKDLRSKLSEARARLEEIDRQIQARTEELHREIAPLVEKKRAVEELVKNLTGTIRYISPGHGDPTTVGERSATRSGIRDEIRRSLANRPMRPRDIAADLRQNGFKLPGKSDLGQRVGSELWKMHRRGELRKAGGLYSLART